MLGEIGHRYCMVGREARTREEERWRRGEVERKRGGEEETRRGGEEGRRGGGEEGRRGGGRRGGGERSCIFKRLIFIPWISVA